MERIADAIEHGVVDTAAARIRELEGRIQEQLVRQLFVGHAARQSGVGATPATATSAAWWISTTAWNDARQTVVVKLLQRLIAGNLLQLAPQPLDLRAELELELGISGLVRWEVSLGLVQRDERVLDAAGELGLVGDLPRLEAFEEFEQQRRKVLAQIRRHLAERLLVLDHRADLLELLQQRRRRIQQRVLQSAHRLKHMRRAVCDHEARQEHPHVDVLRSERARRRAMAERRQQVDALKASLGDSDDLLLAEQDDQAFETGQSGGLFIGK
jgi:hypothetical protein